MKKTLEIHMKELREQLGKEIIELPLPENLDANVRLGFQIAQIRFHKLVRGESSEEKD